MSEEKQAAKKRGSGLKIVSVVVVLAALGTGYYFWHQYSDAHPSTDDAYIGAPVVRIAPQVTGTVLDVGTKAFSTVKQGQMLVKIDPAPFKVALQAAEAGLQQARQQVSVLQNKVNAASSALEAQKASLADAEKQAARMKSLAADGTVSQSQNDQSQTALKEAESNVKSAESALASAKAALGTPGDQNPLILAAQSKVDSAKLNLSHTEIDAPADGFVTDFSLQPGTLATAGAEVTQLTKTDDWWVDANFKESDLTRIKQGEVANVTVDIAPGETFTGKVTAISPASGASFSLFPANNATGNWVKVTQRFPVRVTLDHPDMIKNLRVGASASVTINASGDK